MQVPDSMRAVVFHEHGDRSVLRVEKVPTPRPRAGEVLVKVAVAGANHLDVHTRRGIPGIQLEMPHIPGSDAAGTVAAVGAGADPSLVGRRVAVNPMLVDGTCEFCVAGEHSLCPRIRLLGEHVRGTYAEYVAVPAANLLPMPDDASFETAAAGVLVYQTAWRMLRRARLEPGETVLVVGASGGVGSALVDIARWMRCRVLATARGEEKAARARALGADLVLDPEREDLARRVREVTGKRGVDVVADHVGKDVYPAAIRSLRRGGRYVTCGATTGNDPPALLHYVFWNQLEVLGSTMASFSETRRVMDLVFRKELAPVVDAVLPLEEAAEAHRRLEERAHFGKVLLRVDDAR